MGRKDPRFLVVGHLNKPHGTKGELFVWPLTDYPEGIYAPGVVLRMGPKDADEPDPDLPPLRIERVRDFRRGYLVTFGGVTDRNGAEALRGNYLFQDIAALEPLQEGEVFYHELLGMEVVTTSGERLGEIAEVYEVRPVDLLEVRRESGTLLIPYLEHIIVSVDAEAGRMTVDPPEGLLDL
jgi:16S rRNA processing protein RimM